MNIAPRSSLILFLIVIGLGFAMPTIANFVREIKYVQLRRSTGDLIRAMEGRRPKGLDEVVWKSAAGWASTAYGNICFSQSHVTYEELERFRVDLDAKLQGRIDLATIDWIWKRLGETGPHGKDYRERFEPMYREELEALLK